MADCYFELCTCVSIHRILYVVQFDINFYILTIFVKQYLNSTITINPHTGLIKVSNFKNHNMISYFKFKASKIHINP